MTSVTFPDGIAAGPRGAIVLHPVVELAGGTLQAVLLRGADATDARVSRLSEQLRSRGGGAVEVLAARRPGDHASDPRQVGAVAAGVSVLVDTTTAQHDPGLGVFVAVVRAAGGRVIAMGPGLLHLTLAELRVLPVDGLLLPRHLVAGLGVDRDAVSTVLALASAADVLGLQTIADGVDDAETLRHVRGMQLDAATGSALAPVASRVEDLPAR